MHVALDDILFTGSLLDFVIVSSQIYTAALTICNWFNDKCFGLTVVKLGAQIGLVAWQDPGLGEETILLLVYFLHSAEVPRQHMLVGKSVHSRKMVDSLVRQHFLYLHGNERRVCPIEVPVSVLVIRKLKIQSSASAFYGSIFTLGDAEDQFG